MKKFLSLCFAFLVLLYSHETMANPQTLKKYYTVGIAPDVVNYIYRDKSKITGYDIDILEYIAKKLNFKINYIVLSRERIKKYLQQSKIDIGLIHALTVKKNATLFNKSVPIDYITFNLVCGKNIKNINDLQDIAGKTVVTIAGSVEEQIILGLSAKADILSYSLDDSSHVDLEQEVLSNKANCTFLINAPYFQDFNVYTFSSNLFREYTTKGDIVFLYPKKGYDYLKQRIDNEIINLKIKKIDTKFKAKYSIN